MESVFKVYRYYLTFKHIDGEHFPEGEVRFEPFSEKRYARVVKQKVWGWVEYVNPLTDDLVFKYKLTPAVKLSINCHDCMYCSDDGYNYYCLNDCKTKINPSEKICFNFFRAKGGDATAWIVTVKETHDDCKKIIVARIRDKVLAYAVHQHYKEQYNDGKHTVEIECVQN